MDTPLLNKKILFIGIGFYDYDDAIRHKLIELGAKVSYFGTSVNDTLYQILRKIGVQKKANNYLQRIRIKNIEVQPKNNDYVFVIKGENLTQLDFDLLKKNNPDAEFILYLWDDYLRIDNRDILIKNFKNIWSFDSEDCKKYGFKFRPLFYREGLKSMNKTIFLSSIGTLHSNRLKIFRNIAYRLDAHRLSYYLKLCSSKFKYLRERYVFHNFSKYDESLIMTSPISFDKNCEIISKSKCVLDIPHASQAGLTIRTIEALKCGCHIITSNKYLTDYTDISKEYYTIIDPDNQLSLDTIISKNIPLSKLSERYSLTSFINELFDIK